MPRTLPDTVARISALGFGAVHEEQPGVDVGYVIGNRDNNVIRSTLFVEFPRRLKEFEKLLNDRHLVGFGDNSDHGINAAGSD